MTVLQLLNNIRLRLAPLLDEFAQADAETIIEQSLNISRARIYTDLSINLNDDDLLRIESVMKRRLRGEPLQYIFGKTFFYDREFLANGDVLIPRPDTETLVETVINAEKNEAAYFIDMGTGSGIIAAVLTAHNPGWTAVAVDVSYRALRTAARNIAETGAYNTPLQVTSNVALNYSEKNNVSVNPCLCKNIHLICSDMFRAITPKNQFDFIVSNPPYISSTQMKALDNSVINYEPYTALYGGEDGLEFYRIISAGAKMYLKDSGRVYLEIGYDQGESVPRIFRDDGWSNIAVIKDLGGRHRVVKVEANNIRPLTLNYENTSI